MRVIAYGAQGYTADLACSFAKGCAVNGVNCELRSSEAFDGVRLCDVIWLYGLHYTRAIFNAYKGRALRVIGDLGYWRERASELPQERRPIRIAVESEQPDDHLTLSLHSFERFKALNLDVEPVTERGESILVAAHSEEQAKLAGYAYGEWEAQTVARLRALTKRRIVLREKPGSPQMWVFGTQRSREKDIGEAIRKSWAVVCRSGNVGADAILHGVPVFAASGPGAVFYGAPLSEINSAQPLSAAARISALADIAAWQWTQEEIERGDLWRHFKTEGMFA